MKGKNIVKQIGVVLSILVLVFTAILAAPPEKANAACSANSANMGQVTGSFNIPTAGTYRVWTRMMPDTTASNNSYTLEVDGTQCNVTVGDATIAQSAWTWVDYRDGAASSKIDMTLTAGNHTFTMYGRETGVKVDRVVFSGIPSCVPSGVGDNCATAPVDSTPPTVSITAPTNGATVSNTVSITANASDNVSVSSVAFYLDGSSTPISTDNTSPYTASWVSSTTTNGTHSLTAKATDSSGLTTTSTAVSVTVSNTVPDTTAPTTSITSPTNGATVTGAITVAASASDNVGVTKVELQLDGVLIGTDTTTPFAFAWNTTTASNGSHTLRTLAYDSAGNGPGQSSLVTVTVNNTVVTPKPGDVNGDGNINITDFSVMLSNWSQSGRTRAQGDLDGNGVVNISDFSILLSNWGL